MEKWYNEEWHFVLETLEVGKDGNPKNCRIGLEPGDTFECDFETPEGFCPTAFFKLFPLLETVRCNGDLRYLGGSSRTETTFICPGGVVKWRVRGHHKSSS